MIYSGSGSGGGGGGSLSTNATIAYLDVPVQASFLKEFFDVKLHIINNAASTFAMTDNVITLNVPDGLTIMDTPGTESSATVTIPRIAGQETTTITWILRGDTAGSYPISADYSGILAEFNEPIYAQFVAEDPIEVYGLDALKLIVELNSNIMYDGFYFNLSVQNIGGADMYLPSVDVMGDSITSYVKKARQPETGEARTPDVELLNQSLSNASGYTQYVGDEAGVTCLAPGMTFTRYYVVYGVSGIDNPLFFHNAAAEIAEDYGIQVEIKETDMDLFSTEDAMLRVSTILNDPDRYAAYKEIMNSEAFYGIQQAVDINGNWLTITGEALNNLKETLINFDPSFNSDDLREQTRKLVAQLLMDETSQEAVIANMHSKEVAIVGDIVNLAAAILQEDGDVAGEEHLMAVFQSREAMTELADHVFGTSDKNAGIFERFLVAAAVNGLSQESLTRLGDGFATLSAKAELKGITSERVGNVASVISAISGVIEVWEDSVEVHRDLIMISASYEEADFLVDTLLEHLEGCKSVRAELNSIKRALENEKAESQRLFAEEIVQKIAGEAGKYAFYTVLPDLLLKDYGNKLFGVGLALASALIKSLDFVFDWNGTIQDVHQLRVHALLTFAMVESVCDYRLSPANEEQAKHTLKSLKYLIKLRMIGEQSFADMNSTKSKSEQKQMLREINQQRDSSFSALNEYAADVRFVE